jgi:hypothetical protein
MIKTNWYLYSNTVEPIAFNKGKNNKRRATLLYAANKNVSLHNYSQYL